MLDRSASLGIETAPESVARVPCQKTMSKVLIIDDDPIITTAYGRLFREHGFEVEVAGDGEQGLAALKAHRPDVALLDLSMPKVNGIEWLNKVREDERFKNLPVVVFTAGTIGWQLRAARNSDVTFILSKERAEPQKIVEAVRTALVTGTWKI